MVQRVKAKLKGEQIEPRQVTEARNVVDEIEALRERANMQPKKVTASTATKKSVRGRSTEKANEGMVSNHVERHGRRVVPHENLEEVNGLLWPWHPSARVENVK
ncbi:hypothetical protein ACQKGL_25515 [Ensifer adhaerens]|uniref:hypothetical protein n=1 Tax=Ensifer adhaerens TaxID=106592 RepID=UPI003D063F91